MKKMYMFGIVAMLMFAMIAAGTMAFQGKRDGPMKEAFESENYEDYVTAYEEIDREHKRDMLSEEEFEQKSQRMQERAEKREEMQEYKEKLKAAIESGDFDEWYQLQSELEEKMSLTNKIDSENFDNFVAMHNARQDGDHDTASELRKDLGIEHPMHHFGHKHKRMQRMYMN